MNRYTSENTKVLAEHWADSRNRRMLLLHECESGRLEYVIGSYFTIEKDEGGPYRYSWDWGHYFQDVVDVVDYWKSEVVGEV